MEEVEVESSIEVVDGVFTEKNVEGDVESEEIVFVTVAPEPAQVISKVTPLTRPKEKGVTISEQRIEKPKVVEVGYEGKGKRYPD